MMTALSFFINNILLGIGLSMDAFSVSLADGISEPKMKKNKAFTITLFFAVFQGVMPLLGWAFVKILTDCFENFKNIIPVISLILLSFIGGKMLYDNLKTEETEFISSISLSTLLFQAIATSIDAMSVGFTTAKYSFILALLSSLIISIITFYICNFGIKIGKGAGEHLAEKAKIIGGIILILIGFEIFITSLIK